MDALASMQDAMPDVFITGAKIEDMDGLEHLESFIETKLPTLIVVGRQDQGTPVAASEVMHAKIAGSKRSP